MFPDVCSRCSFRQGGGESIKQLFVNSAFVFIICNDPQMYITDMFEKNIVLSKHKKVSLMTQFNKPKQNGNKSKCNNNKLSPNSF